MSDYDKKGKVCIELTFELLEDFDSTMIELSHPDFDGSIYLTMPNIAKAAQKISDIEHVSFFSSKFLDDGVEEDPDEPVAKPKPKPIIQVMADEEDVAVGKALVKPHQNGLESFVGGMAGLFNTAREVRLLLKEVKESKAK